jgi:peptidoglycan/LPS O-acetylase OafA/YrhL
MMMVSAALMLSNDWFDVNLGWGAGGFNWASMPFGLFRVFYSFPAGVLIFRLVCEKQLLLPQVGTIPIFLVFPLFFISHVDWHSKLSMIVGFPLMVAFASRSEPSGVLRRICAELGNASYAIYAIHYPLIGFAWLAQGKFKIDPQSSYIGVCFLVSIVPISLLIDRWYDRPVRALLTSRLVTRTTYPSSAPSGNPHSL